MRRTSPCARAALYCKSLKNTHCGHISPTTWCYTLLHMYRARRRLLPVALLGLAAMALVIAVSTTGFAPVSSAGPETAALFQEATPIPAETGISQPGSTTSIEWMGILIVAIILLPIVFSKNTWKKP